MTASRFLPADPADFLRSTVPLALLAVAAAFPVGRIAILVVLGVGAVLAIGRHAPVRWTLAAAVPVAVSPAWGTWPAPLGAADGSDCATPLSNVALWRVGEAVVVLGVLAALALTMRASSGSLSLRLPAARYARFTLRVMAGPDADVIDRPGGEPEPPSLVPLVVVGSLVVLPLLGPSAVRDLLAADRPGPSGC
ncbi:MAG: hypothetical protein M3O77_04065 [Chloroflexota bacterium]|nr:hypothetical protein [Chloroflexota bacterium]